MLTIAVIALLMIFVIRFDVFIILGLGIVQLALGAVGIFALYLISTATHPDKATTSSLGQIESSNPIIPVFLNTCFALVIIYGLVKLRKSSKETDLNSGDI